MDLKVSRLREESLKDLFEGPFKGYNRSKESNLLSKDGGEAGNQGEEKMELAFERLYNLSKKRVN